MNDYAIVMTWGQKIRGGFRDRGKEGGEGQIP